MLGASPTLMSTLSGRFSRLPLKTDKGERADGNIRVDEIAQAMLQRGGEGEDQGVVRGLTRS